MGVFTKPGQIVVTSMLYCCTSTRTLSNYTDNVVGWVTAQLPLDADDEQRFADAETELTRGQARLKAAKNELAKLKDTASGLAARANQPIPLSDVGGIALDEIDEHGMLRRVPGTFVAGEMLDWDAPTGG